jgi:hypothetical protein
MPRAMKLLPSRFGVRAPRAAVLTMVIGALAAVVAGVVLGSRPSFGAASGSDGPGGTVSVGASTGGSSGPTAGEPAGQGGSGGGNGSGASPWTCTYTKLVLNDEGGIAPGGPTPGSWYSVTCNDGLTGATVTQTEWIPNQTAPATPATPAVDPRALALQAEQSLELPSPTLHSNPSRASVVNLPTWLWVDGAIWHSYSVTASAGPVSATAVATPVSVTWTLGDGAVVSCGGPGAPFDPGKLATQQTTSCAHTYRISSAGQPAADGDSGGGSFVVVATVSWSIGWSAQGAPGGGSLPALSTSSSTRLRVEQVESIFTDGFAANPSPRLSPGSTL